MRFVYPYESKREEGSIFVHFPDVAGASTQVDKGEDFDELVRDCLIAALGGYVARHQPPPAPTPARSRRTVTLDIITSAKLALATAMSDANMSNVVLAGKLGVNEKIVRRLLDLDHVSRIDRLEAALAYFGLQAELSVVPKSLIDQHVLRVQS
jgi:antitoxin HicB